MVSLHRLEIENYRSLRRVRVNLGPLNVLVGPNGAGKSNLLDAIRFLGDVARFDLQPAIDRRGEFRDLVFRGVADPPPKSIKFDIQARVTRYASANALDNYSLSFWQRGPFLQRFESFAFKRTRGRGRRINISGGTVDILDDDKNPRRQSVAVRSAGLATLQKLGEEVGADQVREMASIFETFRVFDVNVAAARQPAALEKHPVLSADASNLAPFLLWLRQADAEILTLIEDDLRRILPNFERFKFHRVGGATQAVSIELVEAPLKRATPLTQASLGTIRALALLAMLHDPNPPRLTCVEEIDHGLHPYALDCIVERMRDASTRTQLLIATHSPSLVNRLKPDELIICERDADTGASRIPAIDPGEVYEMTAEAELDLGEIWFSGALGGVPQ